MLTEVKALETKEVSFNGQTLLGFIDESGNVYTSLKKICENLGLDWSRQLKKIKEHSVLIKGMGEMSIPTNSGYQKAIGYNVDFLPSWLLTIKPKKVKEEVRPLLEKYQLEAVKVLRDAFIKKEVPQQEQKTLSLSEMLLVQAQLNVDLEKKLSQVNSQVSVLDQKVKQILEQKEEGLKKLDCIEYSETLPLFKTERTKVRQLVNAYAGAFNCSPKEVWNKLYTEFYYRYKRNIKLLAENRNMKPLDFVESSGLMQDLYNLASNLLRV